LFAHALVARSAALHLLDCPQHRAFAPIRRRLILEPVRRCRDPAREGILYRLCPHGVDPDRAPRSPACLVEQQLGGEAQGGVGHEYGERACVPGDEFR
jgi:hypothetical protein